MKKRWIALLTAGTLIFSGALAFPDAAGAEETDNKTAESVTKPMEETAEIPLRLIRNLEKYAPEGESIFPELSSSAYGGREEVIGLPPVMPSEGNVKTLVILTEFQDAEFTAEFKADLKAGIFRDRSESKPEDGTYPVDSLRAYYQRSSFGKLNIDGEFTEYRSEHERSWYRTDQNNCPSSLYQEALDAFAKETVEKERAAKENEERSDLELLDAYLAQFDLDNDMSIDGCYLACAGGNDGWAGKWWSYRAPTKDLHIGSYHLPYVIQVVDILSAAGVKGKDDAKDYILSFIHETGHQLGLLDCYSYGNLGLDKYQTFGMMTESLNGEMDGFSRMLLGWLPEESVHWVTEDGVYEIKPYAENGDVYLIRSKQDASAGNPIYSQYILAEYYKNEENDTVGDLHPRNLPIGIITAPTEGMRFYHIYARLNSAGNDFVASDEEDTRIPLISAYNRVLPLVDNQPIE